MVAQKNPTRLKQWHVVFSRLKFFLESGYKNKNVCNHFTGSYSLEYSFLPLWQK